MTENRLRFGSSRDGSTFVVGNPEVGVGRIYIESRHQFAPNDFVAMLNRFGVVNNMRNSDFQVAVQSTLGNRPPTEP